MFAKHLFIYKSTCCANSYADISIFANFQVIVLDKPYNNYDICHKTHENITRKWVNKTHCI